MGTTCGLRCQKKIVFGENHGSRSYKGTDHRNEGLGLEERIIKPMRPRSTRLCLLGCSGIDRPGLAQQDRICSGLSETRRLTRM